MLMMKKQEGGSMKPNNLHGKYFAWLRQITPIVYDNAKSIYEVLSEIIPIIINIKANQDDFSTEMDNHYNYLTTEKQKLEKKMQDYLNSFLLAMDTFRNEYNLTKKDIKDTIEDIVRRYLEKYQEKLNTLKNTYDTKTKDITDTIDNIQNEYATYYQTQTTELKDFIKNLINNTLDSLNTLVNSHISEWQELLKNKEDDFDSYKTTIDKLINDSYQEILEKIDNYFATYYHDRIYNNSYIYDTAYGYNGTPNYITDLPTGHNTIANMTYLDKGKFYVGNYNLSLEKITYDIQFVSVGEDIGYYYLGFAENSPWYVSYSYSSINSQLSCYLVKAGISSSEVINYLVYTQSDVTNSDIDNIKASINQMNTASINDHRIIVHDITELCFLGIDSRGRYHIYSTNYKSLNIDSVFTIHDEYIENYPSLAILTIHTYLYQIDRYKVIFVGNHGDKTYYTYRNNENIISGSLDSYQTIYGLVEVNSTKYILEKNNYNTMTSYSLKDLETFEDLYIGNSNSIRMHQPYLYFTKGNNNLIDYDNNIYCYLETDMIKFSSDDNVAWLQGYSITDNGKVRFNTKYSQPLDVSKVEEFNYENNNILDLTEFKENYFLEHYTCDYYYNNFYLHKGNSTDFYKIKREMVANEVISRNLDSDYIYNLINERQSYPITNKNYIVNFNKKYGIFNISDIKASGSISLFNNKSIDYTNHRIILACFTNYNHCILSNRTYSNSGTIMTISECYKRDYDEPLSFNGTLKNRKVKLVVLSRDFKTQLYEIIENNNHDLGILDDVGNEKVTMTYIGTYMEDNKAIGNKYVVQFNATGSNQSVQINFMQIFTPRQEFDVGETLRFHYKIENLLNENENQPKLIVFGGSTYITKNEENYIDVDISIKNNNSSSDYMQISISSTDTLVQFIFSYKIEILLPQVQTLNELLALLILPSNVTYENNYFTVTGSHSYSNGKTNILPVSGTARLNASKIYDKNKSYFGILVCPDDSVIKSIQINDNIVSKGVTGGYLVPISDLKNVKPYANFSSSFRIIFWNYKIYYNIIEDNPIHQAYLECLDNYVFDDTITYLEDRNKKTGMKVHFVAQKPLTLTLPNTDNLDINHFRIYTIHGFSGYNNAYIIHNGIRTSTAGNYIDDGRGVAFSTKEIEYVKGSPIQIYFENTINNNTVPYLFAFEVID